MYRCAPIVVAALSASLLAGCGATTQWSRSAPDYPEGYKPAVLGAMQQNFVDPASIRNALITPPRPVSGAAGGLEEICVVADAMGADGEYTGPQFYRFTLEARRLVSAQPVPGDQACGDRDDYQPFPEAERLQRL